MNTNRRTLSPWFCAAAAATALLVAAAPARADEPIRGDAVCTDSDAASTFYNPSYVACSAHYNGVPAPQTTLVDPFAGYGDFRFVGQTTNAPDSGGPFQAFGPGVTFGDLALKTARTTPFVIALASAGDYSLYLYDPSRIGGAAVSTIGFSTFGTTNIIFGPEGLPPYALQYANLYAPVPEPASGTLLLGGLALAGLGMRRRHPA